MRGIIFALALAAGTDAFAATALSPERIARDIETDGVKAVVDRLWNSGDYDRLLNHIDKGTPAWVALAPKLAAGTDAGASEELTIALAYALPRNPQAVLSVLDVCATNAEQIILSRNPDTADFRALVRGEPAGRSPPLMIASRQLVRTIYELRDAISLYEAALRASLSDERTDRDDDPFIPF